MPDDTVVKVADVVVPRNRMRVANHIDDLAESIRKNGLLHPITLRRDGQKLILVAGRRRLEATKLLKEAEIRAKVLDVDQTQALLIEIDENLQRAELTELQRAQHVEERKKIWESLHPETRHGGAPPKKSGKGGKATPLGKDEIISSLPNGRPAPSFVEETAKRAQTSRRTIEYSAQIGANICRKAQKLLEGTTVEDKKTDLLKIARLKDKDEQVEVARLIHDGKATTFVRAKKLIDAEKIKAEPQPLPSGPFRVVVADPPWQYDKRDDDSSKRENTTYATMSLSDIKALGVASMTTDDAVLWLWTTNAHMQQAFAVAHAWGFTCKTILTWDKVRVGMGDWLRGQTEHCLLCTRGSPTVVLTNQTTLIRETNKGHSKKPDKFYELVEALCPGSKVELFARMPRKGWKSWGSEQLDAQS